MKGVLKFSLLFLFAAIAASEHERQLQDLAGDLDWNHHTENGVVGSRFLGVNIFDIDLE